MKTYLWLMTSISVLTYAPPKELHTEQTNASSYVRGTLSVRHDNKQGFIVRDEKGDHHIARYDLSQELQALEQSALQTILEDRSINIHTSQDGTYRLSLRKKQ